MSTRANPFRAFPILVAFLLNLVVGPLAPMTQIASAPVLGLSGSSFNATDANLTDDSGPEIDWCTPSLSVVTKEDLPTGQTDNSYKAAKENELNPEVAFGSIPNNKVDLDRLYISSETSVDGKLFIYVGWIRNDTSGTGTISFELNQSDVLLSNGINHERTEGDLLIEFNFQANPGSQGGYQVVLTYREWDGTEWGDSVSLGSLAEGQVNDAPIEDCRNGDNELGTGEFGEFALNLTDLLGGECRAFGSIFAKSRSSNQITSELKEVMAPVPVDFSTCGQITILKEDENGDPLGGATFSVTPNPFTETGSLSVEDNEAPDDDDDPGVIHLSDVEPGEYEVCETDAPDGYIIDTHCETLTVGVNGSATFGPWENGLGDISWVKKDEQSGDKVGGATFTLKGIGGAADGFGPITVEDNDPNDADDDAGEFLVTGLLLGTYLITETVPPNNYDLPDDPDQEVELDGETAAAEFAFEDPPQADASIEKDAVLSPIVAGDDASFDVVVTAGGTGTSEDVVLTDLNETDHTWEISGPDAGDCGVEPITVAPDATLSCDFGDIENGDTRQITISMTGDADDCEVGIANTASIVSSNDHDESNNEDSASITVLCPNPGVVKDGEVTPIVFGEDAVFTVTVNAGGDGPATNVVLTDLNETGHDWTVSGADSAACADLTVADDQALTCTWDEIPAGESRSITITMTSGEEDCDLGIDNNAEITADVDVDESNDSDNAHIDVLCPNPGVTKDAVVSPINGGDDASFTIVVTASGTGNSENVVLSDTNETSHEWTVLGADAGDCNSPVAPGEDLVCDFGTIPNGQSRTVTITMQSDADDCAKGIANTASISADADTDESDNSDTASIDLDCPDIAVDKTGSGTVNATDGVFFEITVSNIGEGDAYDFAFTDTLPDVQNGWTLASFDNPPAACELNGLVLTCSVESDAFLAGDSFTVRVEADTQVADCGDLDNTALASASNEATDVEDPILDNNSDDHTIVVQCPDLAATKTAGDAVVSAGEEIGFTITVTNSDAVGTGTAYNVMLNDLLPFAADGTVDWSVDPANAACEITGAVGAETLSCDFGDLAPGASASVRVETQTSQEDCALFHNVADITSANHEELNPEADTTVQCPGLNIVKLAGPSPIDAGEEASFTVVVWNAGPGTALVTTVHDELPDDVDWGNPVIVNADGDDSCSLASSVGPDGVEHWSFDCEFGDLPPSDMPEAPFDTESPGKVITISGDTDREDCGELLNQAWADASNNDMVGPAEATIQVECPTVEIVKVNDQPDPVLPGTVVSYTLTVTVGDGPAEDVVVTDVLPVGLDAPTSISDEGDYDPDNRTITWNLGDLDDGRYELTYQAAVSLTENGDELVNLAVVTSPNSQCPDAENLADECYDDSIVTVRVPDLVIDKSADTEEVHFVFDAEGNVLSVEPEQVTWTLTYTLTDGPVTNAVITDPLPDFLTFVSASDPGDFDPVTGVITWELGTLTASGSVSFVTTVDPDAPETEPIVNVATIVSDQTPEDDGEDEIRVTSESELGGNPPTPKPSVPDTALVVGPNGTPLSVPVELLVVLFVGSLGALGFANVQAVRRRR